MSSHPPTIGMIQGQHPTSAIFDYCQQLSRALGEQKVETEMAPLCPRRGGLWSYFTQMRDFIRTRSTTNSIFHIHYPGWPLRLQLMFFPQIIAFALSKNHLVTTIHDLTKFPSFIHVLFIPFFLWSRQLIFANEMELAAAQRLMDKFGYDIRSKSHLIPIGSSITRCDAPPASETRKGVVYFGHIRSGKGLEFFLDTAEKMRRLGRSDPFTIIGNIETCDYFRFRYATALASRVYRLTPAMKKSLRKCKTSAAFANVLASLDPSLKTMPNVSWVVNKDEKTCASAIASHRFALMPFKDGASMRRSSLQAVLLNGCITLTTWGRQTDDILKAITLNVTSPDDALALLKDQHHFHPLTEAMQSHEARIDWKAIAKLHMLVFAPVN